MSLPKWLVKQIEDTAQAARDAGQEVNINPILPSISIETGQDCYYLQEWQADELLAEVPPEVTAEDWILYSAQSW